MDFNAALTTVAHWNRQGIPTSLSFLPIEKNAPQAVEEEVLEYEKILAGIEAKNLDADVTVKPHQFGIVKNNPLAAKSIETVVRQAAALKNFVWVDMERPSTVEATIQIFESLKARYGNVGLCLQAYLKQTEHDLKRLVAKYRGRLTVRLVKGFYRAKDFTRWSEVTKNYERLMHTLLETCEKPCLATHDEALINLAKQHPRAKEVEFQFFNGVRDQLALRLSKEGHRVRIYVPYGNVFKFLYKGWPTFDNWRHLQRFFHKKSIQ